MIDRAVELVAARLNQRLRLHLQSDEDLVVVANVVDSDGTPAASVVDKLAFFVVNVQKDDLSQTRRGTLPTGGRLAAMQEPLHLNVFVMAAAGYSDGNYPQALKLISHALRFFQAHPVFDRRTAPELPSGLERLVLDIENLEYEQLSHLWGVLGGRYLPSVLYQMRTVVIAPDEVAGEVETTRAIDGLVGS